MVHLKKILIKHTKYNSMIYLSFVEIKKIKKILVEILKKKKRLEVIITFYIIPQYVIFIYSHA